MQVLGIRTSLTTVRYAILDFSGERIEFVNKSDENKLDFPAAFSRPEEKISWLYSEFDRIFHQYPDVELVVIKQQEYGNALTKSGYYSALLDGIIHFIVAQKQKPIESKFYTSIGTKRAEVKSFVEEKVGKSKTYFNEQMADAIAAAWSGGAVVN